MSVIDPYYMLEIKLAYSDSLILMIIVFYKSLCFKGCDHYEVNYIIVSPQNKTHNLDTCTWCCFRTK